MNTQQFFIIMLIVVISIISISFFSVQSPTGFMPLNDLTEYSSQTLLVSSDRYVNPNDQRTIIKEDTSAQVNVFTGDINDLLPLENDNILSVGWNKLIGFPAGCPSGQAVTTISGVLTCSPFLTSFSETDPYYNADKSSIVFENDNISRLINDANYITSANIPSFSDTNFQTAGYDFDDYVTWSNGSNDLNLFDNNIFANCYYLSDNNYFCGFNDLPIPAFDLSAYAKLSDFNQNIDANSLTANFVTFNYLETDYSQIIISGAGSDNVNGVYDLVYEDLIPENVYGHRVYEYSDFVLEIYYSWTGSEWVVSIAYIVDYIDYFQWYYSNDLIIWFADYGANPPPISNFKTTLNSKAITYSSFDDFETAFSWGNHADMGYLTEFNEIDPYSLHLDQTIKQDMTGFPNFDVNGMIKGNSIKNSSSSNYGSSSFNISSMNNATFSIWIKTNYTPVTYPRRILMFGVNTINRILYMELNLDGTIQAIVEENDGTDHTLISTKTIIDNDWHLLTYTFERDKNLSALYIDGEIEDYRDNIISGSIGVGTTSSVQISTSATNRFIYANFDDFAIWDRALSENEIKDMWNYKFDINPNNKFLSSDVNTYTNLLRLFKFDEESGNTCFDELNVSNLNWTGVSREKGIVRSVKGKAGESFFNIVSDINDLVKPVGILEIGNELSKIRILSNITGNVNFDNNVTANYFIANGFLTLSKVPDVSDTKLALDNLKNIDKWLVTDAKTLERKVNYKEHYAHKEHVIGQEVDYSRFDLVEKQILYCDEIEKDGKEPKCNTKTIIAKEFNYTKDIIVDTLDLEVRSSELEKMSYELHNFIKEIQVQLVDFLNRLTGAENKIKFLEKENILIKSELCKQNDKYSWCVIK